MIGNLKSLGAIENTLSALDKVLTVLLAIAQFLFLTVWGWLIIGFLLITIIIVKSRDKDGEFRFSLLLTSIGETTLFLYSNAVSIITGIAVLIGIYFISGYVKDSARALALYREVKLLEAALHNLKTERKVLEIVSTNAGADPESHILTMTYYAWDPVQEKDVETFKDHVQLSGRRFYLDFGVLNFDYSLVETGKRKNLAFPNRIFTDRISYEDGPSVLKTTNRVPYTFLLDGKALYSIDPDEYAEEIASIMEAVTNDKKARRMGIRSSYGEAIAFVPENGRLYTFYTSGTGGLLKR